MNIFASDKRPLYVLTALTFYQSETRHYLQIFLSKEMQYFPKVRRFTYVSAFGDGFGLYSEFLGKKVGRYDEPYDEFGRLSYVM